VNKQMDIKAAIPAAPDRVRIWDPFVRLFHWVLALAFAGAWYLGEFGPGILTWHFYFGYVVLGLIGLRLVWGFVGPSTARFRSFIFGPAATLSYLRHMFNRSPSYTPGHNPIGGFYVLVFLVVIVALAVTGMLADPDDYVNIGPLAKYVSSETARQAVVWHVYLANLALVMTVFHVASIVFYAVWKREDLVRPMITGMKLVRRGDVVPRDSAGGSSPVRAMQQADR
jgi:cytochrome b